MQETFKVLIADLVGLKPDQHGKPDPSEVGDYIGSLGHNFHLGLHDASANAPLSPGIHFFYRPDLSREEEILPITDSGQYDALIAAATFIPKDSVFPLGGVRIGAGTGNMQATCWGGGDGSGGTAPLMNTPSFNSRATAQMAFKALLKVLPDLDVSTLHEKVCAGDFDTGKQLSDYPTEKIEGKTFAIIGYGNIGREVAMIARAFGMIVRIHARQHHQKWIESEGFEYASSILEAATGADVLSPHTGLGGIDPNTGKFANAGIINDEILSAMNSGAIVINYDRGEVIDTLALEDALTSGKIRHAAIDADLFKDPETGALTGPMVPYLNLLRKHSDKLELLPHAAADTEHVSRVEGAKQAVDQIVACITEKRVTNLKGDLPNGYTDGGAVTVKGVGKVTNNRIDTVLSNQMQFEQLSGLASELANALKALKETQSEGIPDASEFIRLSNTYISAVERLGLRGPYYR